LPCANFDLGSEAKGNKTKEIAFRFGNAYQICFICFIPLSLAAKLEFKYLELNGLFLLLMPCCFMFSFQDYGLARFEAYNHRKKELGLI